MPTAPQYVYLQPGQGVDVFDPSVTGVAPIRVQGSRQPVLISNQTSLDKVTAAIDGAGLVAVYSVSDSNPPAGPLPSSTIDTTARQLASDAGSAAATNSTRIDALVSGATALPYEKPISRTGATTGQIPYLQGDGTLKLAAAPAAGSGEAAVLPTYAPATGLTRRFNPLTSAYGVNAATLAQFRSALAKANAGTGYCHICVIGDSLSAGYMGSTAPVVNDFDNAYVQVLGRRLLTEGVPSGGTGFVRATQAMSNVDARWTFVNGAANGGSGTWSNNAQPWASHSGAGGTATLSLVGGGGTRVEIEAPNNSAKFTYQVLDSTGAVIVPSTAWDGDNTATIRMKSITGLVDAAKLVITTVAGSNLLFSAAVLKSSGLIISNQAFFGSTASGGSGWASNVNWYGARQTAAALSVPADLLLCALGTNDKASNVTDANVGSALTTILGDWPNASRILLGMWEAGGFAAGNNWKNFVGSLFSLADTLGTTTGLVDLVDRSRGFTAMNGRGYYGTDQTHPFKAAHADAGRDLAGILMS